MSVRDMKVSGLDLKSCLDHILNEVSGKEFESHYGNDLIGSVVVAKSDLYRVDCMLYDL